MFGGLHSPQPLPRADALVELGRQFTPRVEARQPSPVLLDLQGLARLWPRPADLGRALIDAAAALSLEVQLALAATRSAALVLARAHPGLTIVPLGGEAAALAPLPLALLGLPPEREELLRRFGLSTIGELARLPAAGLAERFGVEGPRLVRLARGEDEGVLVRAPLAERFETAIELEWPVDGIEPLAFVLARVLEPLCATLAARGRKAAAIRLTLGLAGGGSQARRLAPPLPSAEPRTWRTLLLLELEARPVGDAILRLGVSAEPTAARETQFSLFDPAQPSPERLAETLGRLQAWSADGRAGAPQLFDTHRPGTFTVGTFAPGLAHAAPVAAPPGPRIALRVFRPPRPAQVVLQAGRPAFVAAAGVRGGVAACAGPWRSSGDWWDMGYSRDEWDVALTSGPLLRLFLDRLRGCWFVEGELD